MHINKILLLLLLLSVYQPETMLSVWPFCLLFFPIFLIFVSGEKYWSLKRGGCTPMLPPGSGPGQGDSMQDSFLVLLRIHFVMPELRLSCNSTQLPQKNLMQRINASINTNNFLGFFFRFNSTHLMLLGFWHMGGLALIAMLHRPGLCRLDT